MSAPRTPSSLSRGEASRERLVNAAIELFGERGYLGVGARELTEAAGLPLSALPYYFVTKARLYREAMARVLSRLAGELEPHARAATVALEGPESGLLPALASFEEAVLEVFVRSEAASDAARWLLREHLDPGEAFDLVESDAAAGVVGLIARFVARLTDRQEADPGVRLEAFARVGRLLVFRLLRPTILRSLRWNRIGDDQMSRLKAAIAAVPMRQGVGVAKKSSRRR